jgi:hypothetical protein
MFTPARKKTEGGYCSTPAFHAMQAPEDGWEIQPPQSKYHTVFLRGKYIFTHRHAKFVPISHQNLGLIRHKRLFCHSPAIAGTRPPLSQLSSTYLTLPTATIEH